MIPRFSPHASSAFNRGHACVFTRIRIALCALIVFACTAGAQEADVSREYQIKAAFLYNFAKFVEWPQARFESANSPIVIGVLGQNPFGAELEKIVQDRKVNGRSVSIVMLNSPAEAKMVHLLFVSAGHERRFAGSEAVKCPGVLTVGESQNFAAAGGTIIFTMPDDKVKFEINMGSANCAELRISAQLLKLAAVVRKKS
jgi:hypothetical protein